MVDFLGKQSWSLMYHTEALLPSLLFLIPFDLSWTSSTFARQFQREIFTPFFKFIGQED